MTGCKRIQSIDRNQHMRVTGYSERGVINSLFYEIAYSSCPTELLQKFLDLAWFPTSISIGDGLAEAQIFVEQSLSDFGDADTILLLDFTKARTSVFLEAKVKSSQAAKWTLQGEFEDFKQGLNTKKLLNSSNLFTQLYHKKRFVDGLKSKRGVEELKNGLAFPCCSTKVVRKIGRNPVVRSMVDKIKPYCEEVWYLALVPDTKSNMMDFFQRLVSYQMPTELLGWDTFRWGGLSWETVSDFCIASGMENTCEVLNFNNGQIFSKG